MGDTEVLIKVDDVILILTMDGLLMLPQEVIQVGIVWAKRYRGPEDNMNPWNMCHG